MRRGQTVARDLVRDDGASGEVAVDQQAGLAALLPLESQQFTSAQVHEPMLRQLAALRSLSGTGPSQHEDDGRLGCRGACGPVLQALRRRAASAVMGEVGVQATQPAQGSHSLCTQARPAAQLTLQRSEPRMQARKSSHAGTTQLLWRSVVPRAPCSMPCRAIIEPQRAT